MNRHIKKVAVLGSGVMGSRIACHFANIGCEVILLDIAPKELLPQEEKKGLRKGVKKGMQVFNKSKQRLRPRLGIDIEVK